MFPDPVIIKAGGRDIAVEDPSPGAGFPVIVMKGAGSRHLFRADWALPPPQVQRQRGVRSGRGTSRAGQVAAMRLRSGRQSLRVWNSPASPPGRYVYTPLVQQARAGRIRWWLRTGVLLSVIGLIRVARAVRTRWWPLPAGCVLTAVGIALRGGAGGVVLLPGLVLLLSCLLVPVGPRPGRTERSSLERELAAYATPAHRRDLEATLDRYPDSITDEIRDILTRHPMTATPRRLPGSGRH